MTELSIKTIYEQYYQKVLSYVQARVNNKSEAEDITSDIFLKVMAAIGTYDDSKAQFSTWLYTIASNAVKDHLRKTKIRDKYRCDDSEVFLENIISDESSCDERLFEQQTLELLADALETLSDRERLIIVMHYYSDISHKEIANRLSLSYSNVRYINHQALKKIKTYFKHHEFV